VVVYISSEYISTKIRVDTNANPKPIPAGFKHYISFIMYNFS